MRSNTIQTNDLTRTPSFANAKNSTLGFGTDPLTHSVGSMSDEGYHGVVLAATLRAGAAYLRTHVPALAHRLVHSVERPGVFGGTR